MGFDLYSSIDVTTDDDLYFLRFFSTYNHDFEKVPQIVYDDINSPGMKKMRNEFGLEAANAELDDMSKIVKLKKRAIEILAFPGRELGSKRYDSQDAVDIARIAKEENYSLNCRYRTYLFTLMALACGFKARMVSCLSMDLRYRDCHWVTEIYSNTYKKWIVVDVPLDFFYFDEKGVPLNLLEMRKRIIQDKPIKMLSTNTNHILFAQQYWKKNIFRFWFAACNKYNFLQQKELKFYCLNPYMFNMKSKKYISDDRTICCEYYYNEFGIWEETYV